MQIDIAFQRQDIRAVLMQHRSGWGSVFSHSILSSSLHHLLGVSERSKGGEKQIEWLTEQTRTMAATTHDVQFKPAFPRYDHTRTLIVFGHGDPLYPLQLVVPNGGDGPVFGPNAARFVETATAFVHDD
ncbi:MAG: hypothetical protein DMF08_12740 [Verrucomicrobia bacterium]|nr:MAG: hypothetical protein DMF08_12740 [Verrucomicrobiota bacterium]